MILCWRALRQLPLGLLLWDEEAVGSTCEVLGEDSDINLVRVFFAVPPAGMTSKEEHCPRHPSIRRSIGATAKVLDENEAWGVSDQLSDHTSKLQRRQRQWRSCISPDGATSQGRFAI